MTSLRYDQAFGIIPLRWKENAWELFLICHREGKYWGFPKGHANEGEKAEEAACRELKEETQLRLCRFLSLDPLEENYTFIHDQEKIIKKVLYFLGEVEGEVILQQQEVIGGKWVKSTDAKREVTYPSAHKLCQEIEKRLLAFS